MNRGLGCLNLGERDIFPSWLLLFSGYCEVEELANPEGKSSSYFFKINLHFGKYFVRLG